MVDYLSRENDLLICSDYADIRRLRMKNIIYPAGILILCSVHGDESYKERSLKKAIPEFLRHNIVEAEIRNVC